MSRILTTAAGKPAPEPWGVFCWRYDELRRAGYPVEQAMQLAEDPDVDLHEACRLLAQGCEPERAAAILL